MTALDKYARLEGAGLWTASSQDQRRDVVVSFGEATLVISDSRSMRVLSHWSLPAVVRLNPGKRPALYSPDGDPGEVLELDDDWLIDALQQLQAALQPRRSGFARMRRPILLALCLITVIGSALIIPPALMSHTATVVPMAQRVEFAERVRLELIRDGARPCQSAYGDPALGVLQRALFQSPARIVVMQDLPGTVPRVQHVMGRLFILDARLLDMAASPEALAGALLVAAQRNAEEDPLRPLLRHAGVIATFRLLTSGELPERAEQGYAAAIYGAALSVPDLDPLLERFNRTDLSTRPLVDNPDTLDPAIATLGPDLRAADPKAADARDTALLNDGQWVSLLNICDG